MLSRIEALNFRCLRYVDRPLEPFHVLIGPNGSGKTTFLDVVAFLGQLVSGGLEKAVFERTSDFRDLVWRREDGAAFEVSIEAVIPLALREKLKDVDASWDTLRYHVRIGIQEETAELAVLAESVLLGSNRAMRRACGQLEPETRILFPVEVKPPKSLAAKPRAGGIRVIINKVPGGNDNFYSEVYERGGRGWAPSFKLGPRRSALGNLPENDKDFPVSTWFRSLLINGVHPVVLNSQLMRRASPPGQQRTFKPDGSNLAWVVEQLKQQDSSRFEAWLAHVRTALPDLSSIRTVEREDDKHRYLMIRFANDVEVPSWVISDGTLRLLALTLPAYLTDFSGIYLIEEPENGIHPMAVDTVFQSLSSVYDAQILLATHSPVILSLASADSVLCFSKTAGGATDIVSGREHPRLRDWQGETNLGVLFAGGVLS